VDIDFDIGPESYNFVDVRFIGEPVLRDRIYAPSQNVTYINNTVNVTNITVQNNVVYNYGPDYNVLSSHSTRPIQRLNIQRQTATDLSAAAKSGALTKVQGGTLVVAAPQKISKPAPGVAPPRVKTKVAQPKIEHGWTGVANEAQLKEKIKTENPKNVLPPTGAPGGASPAVAASPAATVSSRLGRSPAAPMVSATPAVSATPFERGKRTGRPGEQPQPGLTGTPTRSPAIGASPVIQGSPAGTPTVPERGKRKGRAGEPIASPGQPTEGIQTTPFPGRNKGRGAPPEFTPPTGAPAGAPEATQPLGKRKGQFERGVASPTPGQPGGAFNEPAQGKHKGRGPEQVGPPSTPGAAPYENTGGRQRGQAAQGQAGVSSATGPSPGEPHGGKQKQQGAYGQPGAGPAGGSTPGAERAQGKPEGGKKKGEKGSPSPGPQ
jgi:hypothetical protein